MMFVGKCGKMGHFANKCNRKPKGPGKGKGEDQKGGKGPKGPGKGGKASKGKRGEPLVGERVSKKKQADLNDPTLNDHGGQTVNRKKRKADKLDTELQYNADLDDNKGVNEAKKNIPVNTTKKSKKKARVEQGKIDRERNEKA